MDEEIITLISSWGFSEYVDVFKANKIDIKRLALLDASLAKELIGPVGDRALFLKYLEEWKILNGRNLTEKSDISEDLIFVDKLSEKHRRLGFEDLITAASKSILVTDEYNQAEQNLISDSEKTPESPANCTDAEATELTSNLEELLNTTTEGKVIINLHKKSGLLSSSSRRKLSNLIIKHLLNNDPEKRISSTTLMNYAQKINLLFPKELISTYFVPYVNNSKLKIKRCAKGKLYDCLQNRRREFRDAKLIGKHSFDSCEPELTNIAEEFEDTTNDDVHFLNVNVEPWHLIEQKWQKTVSFRLKQLNEITIAEYMKLYPVLKKPTGYHLLINDFTYLYPEHQNKLHENFCLYKEKLTNLLLKKHGRSSDLATKEIVLNIQEHYERNEVKSEEIISIQILLLLPLTLAQPQGKSKKSTWRPSKIESRDGFITHVARPVDLLETINRRREKFLKIGVTLQPFIIILGENITDIQSYYIVVNDTFYVSNSVLEAVDTCFKIFYALNCKYPLECVALWTFIQKAFYKIKTPWDKEFVTVNALLSDLEGSS